MMFRDKIVTILILSLLAFAGNAQSQSLQRLQRDRAEAENKLRSSNIDLQENLSNTRSMLNELDLINAEIAEQNKIIKEITNEVSRLNQEQKEIKSAIAKLEVELEEKITSYTKAVRQMGRRRNEYNEFMFILSAESFDQSLRRVRYLKEFSQWRKKQSEEIVRNRQELELKNQQLTTVIAEQESLLAQKTEEANRLKEKQKDKKNLINRLKKEEKALRKEIKQQQQQINKLDNRIEEIIAEETRKAEERARAEREAQAATSSETTTPTTTPDAQYNMTRSDRELSGSFEKNKGKLPFPIKGSYRIVAHFGLQRHAVDQSVKKENLGIDIETTPGTKVRAVFEGEVVRVFSFFGVENSIMLRHGDYYTVYTNLAEVYVKVGDRVSTGQEMGLIYSDPLDNNRTRFSFQIRKKKQKLDPEKWLDL